MNTAAYYMYIILCTKILRSLFYRYLCQLEIHLRYLLGTLSSPSTEKCTEKKIKMAYEATGEHKAFRTSLALLVVLLHLCCTPCM